MKVRWLLSLVAFFVLAAPFGMFAQDDKAGKPSQPSVSQLDPSKVPAKAKISNPIPGYQDYETIGKQLEEWVKEAPGLTETGTYGTSTKGLPLRYIRVTNLLNTVPKKKVLVHACIHGNEPWACSTTMATVGTMLSEYGVKKEATDLIDTRDIYFVPVVSPDSYPKVRRVDGRDPNRDFPDPKRLNHKSIKPIEAIQNFFFKHRFHAVLSGHTFGRWYYAPFADSVEEICAHKKDYDRIVGEMQAMTRYGRWFLLNNKLKEIGTEVDWYYRNGTFALGIEYGTHQKIPTLEQTKTELNNTYRSFLYFLREAPLVVVPPTMKEPKKSEN